MKDIRHLIDLASDWLFGHIQGVLFSFFWITFFQALNHWDLTNYFFIYTKISGLMDWVWRIDFIFTGLGALNWIIRKVYGFISNITFR